MAHIDSPGRIEMIVAVAENGVIGHDGKMPWRLPADLAHFKQVTMDLPVIMGRRTWASIGRPLPGRKNIVISRAPLDLDPDTYKGNNHKGVVQANTPQVAMQMAAAQIADEQADTIMVIGGGQIYRIFEPLATRIHLTQVHANPEGDTCYALQEPTQWRELERQRFAADDKNSADFSFVTLERIESGSGGEPKIRVKAGVRT